METRQIYFYTATIYQWKPLLKTYNFEPIILNSMEYLHDKGCIKVYGFVIMPNHIHLIWEILQYNGKESPVASLMKHTSHEFQSQLRQRHPEALNDYIVDWTSRQYNFWQPKPDWFLLYKEETIRQKLDYVHFNPMRGKWSLVGDPSDYLYSSARFYEKGVRDFSFLYDYRDWC
jgi:putative transposase